LTAHWAAQAARQQAGIAREAHYTDLFTKAVEYLGATREVVETIEFKEEEQLPIKRQMVTRTEPNFEVRLGAIYALERIAHDSERDHWPIMEVLCAYIRNPQNCGLPIKRPDGVIIGAREYSTWIATLKPHVDVQAALFAVGRRRTQRMKYESSLDLSRSVLYDMTLGKMNFERANFRRSHLESILFNDSMGAAELSAYARI
jgi:hypothetical protein